MHTLNDRTDRLSNSRSYSLRVHKCAAWLAALLLITLSAWLLAMPASADPGDAPKPKQTTAVKYSRPDADELPPAVLAVVGTDAKHDHADADGDAKDAHPKGPAQGAFDFGKVSLLDVPEARHTFRIRNISDKPLTITRLLPSCMGTRASA